MVTVLTPTYNRADYLVRLYESLKQQSIQSFQWLIIDDGSTDETERVVQGFTDQSFQIEYYRKNNGGKHTALNYSHKYIKGNFVCIVDSDDWLLPNAIEKIENKICEYSSYKNIKVLVFRRGHSETEPLCSSFPDHDVISNSIDFIVNAKRKGDCCEVISLDALTEFPFPEFPNEYFLGEGYLWNNVGFKYDSVYISDVIYVCEYLEGGLSKSGRRLRIQSPLGGMVNSNTFFMTNNGRKVRSSVLRKEALLFICYGRFAGLNKNQILERAYNRKVISKYYFLGVILFYYWRFKYL